MKKQYLPKKPNKVAIKTKFEVLYGCLLKIVLYIPKEDKMKLSIPMRNIAVFKYHININKLLKVIPRKKNIVIMKQDKGIWKDTEKCLAILNTEQFRKLNHPTKTKEIKYKEF